MPHDVFISYSSADKPVADATCARLEASGIRCWIAPRDILPGSDWGGSIVTAIEESRVMVLVFSSHANESQQVKREVERAVSKGLVVVPVRIEAVMPGKNLEYFLGSPHWLDAITPPLEQHLARLVETLRVFLGEPPPSTAATTPTPSPAAPTRLTGPAVGRSTHRGGVLLGVVFIAAVLGGIGWLVASGDDDTPADPTPAAARSATPDPNSTKPVFTSVTSFVRAGTRATVTVKAGANQACSLDYLPPNESRTTAIGQRNTDSRGSVTWTVNVGNTTSAGKAKLTVVCPDGTATTELNIVSP